MLAEFTTSCEKFCCCVVDVDGFRAPPTALPLRLTETGEILLRAPPRVKGTTLDAYVMSLYEDCMHLTGLGHEMVAYQLLSAMQQWYPWMTLDEINTGVMKAGEAAQEEVKLAKKGLKPKKKIKKGERWNPWFVPK